MVRKSTIAASKRTMHGAKEQHECFEMKHECSRLRFARCLPLALSARCA
jgi:hypothetical protein